MYETYREDKLSLEDLPENIGLHATAFELDYNFVRDGSAAAEDRRWFSQQTALWQLSDWPKLESVTLNIRNQNGENSMYMSYNRLRELLDLRRAAINNANDPVFARKRYYYSGWTYSSSLVSLSRAFCRM
jgi:hypothetical protein